MAENKDTKKKKKYSLKEDLYDWLQCIVFVIVACVVLFVFVGRIVTVDGRSMNPTLYHGDKLVVSSIGRNYEQGDVVVFVAPDFDFTSGPLVKRIIATEGQVVEIDFSTGTVSVDGVPLDEPYIAELTVDMQDYDGPVTVPEGHVFCMGDNRNHSTDSRTDAIGCVDTREILGKAYFVLFPLKSIGTV